MATAFNSPAALYLVELLLQIDREGRDFRVYRLTSPRAAPLHFLLKARSTMGHQQLAAALRFEFARQCSAIATKGKILPPSDDAHSGETFSASLA
jgi:hypothetical protein